MIESISLFSDRFYELQDVASNAQAVPVVGVIPSVFKGALSCIEIVTALALIVFSAIPALFNNDAKFAFGVGFEHLGSGFFELSYSVVNIVTFGFFTSMTD